MKKSTLIRSDKPHTVKIAEGTNVAQRKSVKKSSAPDAPDEAPDNIQKLPRVKPATTALPDTPSKPARAKAPARQAEAPPKPSKLAKPANTAKPAKTAKPRTSAAKTQAQAPLDAKPAAVVEPVWEQDNPIKLRIEKLKNRNAQLAEQLQRLQLSPTARGQKP